MAGFLNEKEITILDDLHNFVDEIVKNEAINKKTLQELKESNKKYFVLKQNSYSLDTANNFRSVSTYKIEMSSNDLPKLNEWAKNEGLNLTLINGNVMSKEKAINRLERVIEQYNGTIATLVDTSLHILKALTRPC
jgi:hypothetical protein